MLSLDFRDIGWY